MAAASYGTFGKLGIDSANPITKRYNYIDEDLALIERFENMKGINGTRAYPQELEMPVSRAVRGPIRMQPNSLEMAAFLPWILCGTTSGTPTVTYNLGETAVTRYVTIDRVTKVPTYDTCGVATARFFAQQFSSLQLTLELIGIDETVGSAGSFPSTSIDLTTKPFMLHHLSLSIASTVYQCRQFDLLINNMTDEDRYFNSLTLTQVNHMDRIISFRTLLPYADAVALYNTGTTGAAVVATFTNGSAVLTMTMPKVVFPRRSPNTREGRREIMMPIEGFARTTSTTQELTTTLNPGP